MSGTFVSFVCFVVRKAFVNLCSVIGKFAQKE